MRSTLYIFLLLSIGTLFTACNSSFQIAKGSKFDSPFLYAKKGEIETARDQVIVSGLEEEKAIEIAVTENAEDYLETVVPEKVKDSISLVKTPEVIDTAIAVLSYQEILEAQDPSFKSKKQKEEEDEKENASEILERAEKKLEKERKALEELEKTLEDKELQSRIDESPEKKKKMPLSEYPETLAEESLNQPEFKKQKDVQEKVQSNDSRENELPQVKEVKKSQKDKMEKESIATKDKELQSRIVESPEKKKKMPLSEDSETLAEESQEQPEITKQNLVQERIRSNDYGVIELPQSTESDGSLEVKKQLDNGGVVTKVGGFSHGAIILDNIDTAQNKVRNQEKENITSVKLNEEASSVAVKPNESIQIEPDYDAIEETDHKGDLPACQIMFLKEETDFDGWYKNQLSGFAGSAKKSGDYTIRIQAESSENDVYASSELTSKRVENIKSFLKQNGVPENSIIVEIKESFSSTGALYMKIVDLTIIN